MSADSVCAGTIQNARLRLRFDVDVKGDLPEHAGGGPDTDLAPLQPVQNDLASFVRQDGNETLPDSTCRIPRQFPS